MVYAIIWYLTGVASFIYWWTSEYDLGYVSLSVALYVGIIGPFVFPLGFIIHGKDRKIFIKNRGNKNV